jgi:hypothetical protein
MSDPTSRRDSNHERASASARTTADVIRMRKRKREQDKNLGVNRTSEAQRKVNPGDIR